MDEQLLAALLPELPPPLVLQETDSTNRVLRELAQRGAPEGTAVLARRQTGGKGRMGRTFHSPEGGIYLSVLLRPTVSPQLLPLVTPMAAVAVCGAVRQLCRVDAGIKWVNDLILNGKKLCGILTEAVTGGAVVGIGVNYQQPEEGYPPELAAMVTSLYPHGGGQVPMEALTAEIIRRLIALSAALPDTGFLREYRLRSILPGQPVTVYPLGGQPYPATAVEIDDQARLVVACMDGRRLALQSGEVSVRPVHSAAPEPQKTERPLHTGQ